MLTGRFQLAAPGVEAADEDRRRRSASGRAPTAPRDAARWTRRRDVDAGRRRHPSRSATAIRPRWARSTSARRASIAPIPGLGDGRAGPRRRRPGADPRGLAERIRRHPGELKNLLRNQAFVAGIGNAYSDEILHAARLLPFRKRSTLAAEEVDALYAATRTTLARRDRRPARARPADVRDAGARLPRGPRQGRPGLPALRDADHRGQGRRLRDVLLPRLPALSRRDPVRASFRTWPTFRLGAS